MQRGGCIKFERCSGGAITITQLVWLQYAWKRVAHTHTHTRMVQGHKQSGITHQPRTRISEKPAVDLRVRWNRPVQVGAGLLQQLASRTSDGSVRHKTLIHLQSCLWLFFQQLHILFFLFFFNQPEFKNWAGLPGFAVMEIWLWQDTILHWVVFTRRANRLSFRFKIGFVLFYPPFSSLCHSARLGP